MNGCICHTWHMHVEVPQVQLASWPVGSDLPESATTQAARMLSSAGLQDAGQQGPPTVLQLLYQLPLFPDTATPLLSVTSTSTKGEIVLLQISWQQPADSFAGNGKGCTSSSVAASTRLRDTSERRPTTSTWRPG